VSWQVWRSWFPEATVVFPTQQYRERYKRNPYGVYHGSDKLRFPVFPLPATPPSVPKAWDYKERIVAVLAGETWSLYPLALLIERAGESGEWRTDQNGVDLRYLCETKPMTVAVFIGDSREFAPTVYSYWFAWYAHHADVFSSWSKMD
jgi:hypothetical protein